MVTHLSPSPVALPPARASRAPAGAFLAAVASGLLASCSPSSRMPPPLPPPSTDSPAPVPRAVLAAGEPLPALQAAGWLNGTPPVPGKGPHAMVVDLWAPW
jgi:hypothetical protein